METETVSESEKEMNLFQILGNLISGIFGLIYRIILVILVLSFFGALFFHFIIRDIKRDNVFETPIMLTIMKTDAIAKENVSLSKIFVFQDDIDNLIKRYNDASLIERVSIRQEPLTRKLMEKGFIGNEK